MDAAEIARIRNSPAFRELERKRSTFSWSLTILMLIVYLGFIFLVAFDHSLVAKQVGDGPLTLAFPLGLGVIVLAIVLTGIYVARANTEFDRLTAEIAGSSQRPTGVLGRRVMEGV